MKDITREQIDKALAELKSLRRDKAYSGRLGPSFAMCYSTSFFTTVYDWERLPYKHTCSSCQKEFGGYEDKPMIGDMFSLFSKKDQKPLPDIQAGESKYKSICEVYTDMKRMGYDVVLEFNCAECIKQKQAHPVVFKFRVSSDIEYTVSYPLIMEDGSRYGRDRVESEKGKYFDTYKYSTAATFLERVWHYAGCGLITEACRRWLDDFKGSITYEGMPWSAIFDILKGILGIDLGE